MPSAEEMRAAGMGPEDYDAVITDVWEENWPSVQFFARLATQWRHGMAGPTGLDYASVLALLRSMRLPREQAAQIFDDVQAMERAALAVIHEKE